jgi:predicted permease
MNVPLLFTVLSSLWLIMHLLFYETIKHEHILIYYAWASNCVFLFLVDVLSIIALSGIKNHLIIAFAFTFMFSFLTVSTLTACYIYYTLICSKNKNNNQDVVHVQEIEMVITNPVNQEV